MKSRFIKTRRWKLPRHKKSKRVIGSFEDYGRYLKCWNCGFLIDTKRGLGAGDGSGIQVTDFPTPESQVDLAEPIRLYWDSPVAIGLGDKLGLDGTPDRSDVYSPRKAEAFAGCPFCGTRNLP
jgi:hypothetical protein